VAAANLNEKVGLDPAHARDRSWRGNESTELSARTRRSTSGSENQNLRTALQTEAGPDRHALLTKRRKPTRRRNEIRPAQENQAPMSVASARAVRREERGRQSLDKEPKEKQILLALSAKDRTEEESVRKAWSRKISTSWRDIKQDGKPIFSLKLTDIYRITEITVLPYFFNYWNEN
jgi:hypothetical protein